MNDMLFEWIRKCCPAVGKSGKLKSDQLSKPNVTPKEVCEKAKAYNDLLSKLESPHNKENEKPFVADQNWYNDFVVKALQKNIKLKLAPQNASLSEELTSGKYQREQIWMGAHFGLFYLRLPEGSIFAKHDATLGKKRSRKHLSLLLTANMADDSHQMKSLIVLSTQEDLRETKAFKDSMVLELDKAKGRITKEIMLKWLRASFYEEARAYYEEKKLLINFEIPPTVLFLNECFKEYLKDETLPPQVKICFFSEGKQMDIGAEINTKTFIVKPFVTRYLKKVLQHIDADEIDSILNAWNDFDIHKTFDLIELLRMENYRSHIAAFIPQFCFNCSPIFNDYTLKLFQEEVQETMVQIVNDSNRLELGISINELTSLIEDNLNFSSVVEDLTADAAAATTMIPPASPSTSATKRPASSSCATPKSKLPKLSPSLTDPQKGRITIDKFHIENAVKSMKNAQNELKSFSDKLDATAKQELQILIEHWEGKLAKLEESLAFGHKQTSITNFFSTKAILNNKSTSSPSQSGDDKVKQNQ